MRRSYLVSQLPVIVGYECCTYGYTQSKERVSIFEYFSPPRPLKAAAGFGRNKEISNRGKYPLYGISYMESKDCIRSIFSNCGETFFLALSNLYFAFAAYLKTPEMRDIQTNERDLFAH